MTHKICHIKVISPLHINLQVQKTDLSPLLLTLDSRALMVCLFIYQVCFFLTFHIYKLYSLLMGILPVSTRQSVAKDKLESLQKSEKDKAV